MDKKLFKFQLDPKSLKVKELLNKDFLELEVKAISTANPNRNRSHFTLESLQKAIPTFYSKPILGSFSVARDDFRGHEGELEYDEEYDQLYYDYTDESSEIPLGMIRESDNIEIYHDAKDDLDWLKFSCVLWTKYNYKQVKKLLKSKDGHKKISVEIEVNDSHYTEEGIEIINDFTFDGVTILGDHLETGIADANLTILDMVDNANFAKKQRALNFAYQALDNAESSESSQGSNIIDSFAEPNNKGSIEPDDNKEGFVEPIANEAPEQEISMQEDQSREGGKNDPMELTANAKMELLNASLRDNLSQSYGWVMDIDSTYVYMSIEESTFRAPYEITESDEGHNAVINFDAKEKVTRAWTVFSEEENEETNEETFAQDDVCPDCGKNPCECESKECEEKGSEADDNEDNKEVEACGEKEEEACGDNKESEACGDNKEEESCEKCAAEEDVCPDCGKDPCVCESKECNEAEFSAEEETVEEHEEQFAQEEATVELDGEQVNLATLFERYTALNEKYNELIEAAKAQELKNLIAFGENLINSDEEVDEESKKEFVNQMTEQCNEAVLKSEDEISKFVKGLFAMYYYENKVLNKEKKGEEFSVDIHEPETKAEKTSKLKDATYRLNHI